MSRTNSIPSFIVGCGRSGTTLLRAMLDSHPDVAVPPESYFVVALLKQRALFESATGLDREAVLDELLRAPSFLEWGLDREDIESWPGFASAADVPSALAAAYDCYADRHGKTRTLDKTPFQGPNVGLLASSFPGARFIHLVRDGRNVAQSLRSMDFGPDSLDGAILEWRRHLDAIDGYRRRTGGDDVLDVRYEDLVADAERVLGTICAHLGLDYDPAMLAYPDRADQVLAGMDRTAHLEGVRRAPTGDPRDWRGGLDDGQIALLEGLAGDALTRHGYELATGRPSVADRVRVARSHLLYRARAMRLGLGARRARHRRARRVKALAEVT